MHLESSLAPSKCYITGLHVAGRPLKGIISSIVDPAGQSVGSTGSVVVILTYSQWCQIAQADSNVWQRLKFWLLMEQLELTDLAPNQIMNPCYHFSNGFASCLPIVSVHALSTRTKRPTSFWGIGEPLCDVIQNVGQLDGMLVNRGARVCLYLRETLSLGLEFCNQGSLLGGALYWQQNRNEQHLWATRRDALASRTALFTQQIL